jgi:RNA polymerase subunit RPABC4/transcription elongation factor Spt4
MTPTRACAGCGTQLDARWAFCPECGARPPRACASCAQPLEATWRLCPFCGASAAAPGAEAARPHTEPSSVAIATTAAATQPPDLVLSWSLAGRLQAIYTRPLLKALEVVNRAPDVPSALALMEPAVMRRACGVGVSALAEQRTQTWVPEALRPRLAALAADGERLLRPLEPSLRDLGAAIAMARGVELSTGAADAALQLVRNVNDERTAASRGYAIGAEIGRAFKHPVIGAVVGAMFGQNQADHRSQQLLAQVDRTFVAFCRECDELFPQIWDRLVADVPEPSLAGSARLRTGVDEWERLLASYPDMTNQDVLRFRDEVTTFVDVHGPVPGAAHALIRSTLPPYTPIAFDIAEPWVRFQLAVFPAEPTAYEDAADVALARGALGECHTLVNPGPPARRHPPRPAAHQARGRVRARARRRSRGAGTESPARPPARAPHAGPRAPARRRCP